MATFTKGRCCTSSHSSCYTPTVTHLKANDVPVAAVAGTVNLGAGEDLVHCLQDLEVDGLTVVELTWREKQK